MSTHFKPFLSLTITYLNSIEFHISKFPVRWTPTTTIHYSTTIESCLHMWCLCASDIINLLLSSSTRLYFTDVTSLCVCFSSIGLEPATPNVPSYPSIERNASFNLVFPHLHNLESWISKATLRVKARNNSTVQRHLLGFDFGRNSRNPENKKTHPCRQIRNIWTINAH